MVVVCSSSQIECFTTKPTIRAGYNSPPVYLEWNELLIKLRDEGN